MYDAIESVHNMNVGHHGIRKTIAKLKSAALEFSNLRPSVEKFIKECPLCQKTSQRKVAATALPFTLATTVAMQNLNIDTIGPLPEDPDGYKYILTIIDMFSRWVSLYPLRSVEAEEAGDALIHHFEIFGAEVLRHLRALCLNKQLKPDGALTSPSRNEYLTQRYTNT